MKLIGKNIDLGLFVLRLTIGVLMLLHGIHKLFHGLGCIKQLVVKAGFPSFFAYGVYIGEILVPLLLIVGYRTRIAAVIFAMNCLAAAWLTYRWNIFSLNANGGWIVELLGLFFFGAVTLVVTGGGKYAISKKSSWD